MTTETLIIATAEQTPAEITTLTIAEAVTIYRGAHWNGSDWAHRWWSADQGHASMFGATRRGTLDAGATVAVIDCRRHPEMSQLDGLEADALVERMVNDLGVDALALVGWEAELDFYMHEDAAVTMDDDKTIRCGDGAARIFGSSVYGAVDGGAWLDSEPRFMSMSECLQ